jgi:hypothetical protein
MRESWRTYVSFVLVGAIFILCQALSGGVPGNRAEGQPADPGDRSYRDALRDETSGRGGVALTGVPKVAAPRPGAPREAQPQTN